MNKCVKGKHDHPGSDDALVIPAVTVWGFRNIPLSTEMV